MIEAFIVIGFVMAGLLWRRVFQEMKESDAECARIRLNALKIKSAMTYREQKEMLKRRFPYIVDGRFEDGTKAMKERMNDILADAAQSLYGIREMALQHLKEEEL